MNRRKIFEFDEATILFGKVSHRIWKILRIALLYLMFTFTLAVLCYAAFALLFRTDTESRLRREIKMYESQYPSMLPREELLGDAIAHLQHKDNEIYGQVFHSDAPSVDPAGSIGLVASSDTIPDTRLTSYTRDKADLLLKEAQGVDLAFAKVFKALADSTTLLPPMTLPLRGITYPQIGASSGRKINPFYKAYVFHEGLDFIVGRGTPVYASAGGTVQSAKSSKGTGNSIAISHADGYVTVYSHLENMMVHSGQRVRRGQQIATVGMSGQSSAPHLHYEIRHDGQALDPVHYIFASVTPDEYANMLYMAVNTMQSMD